MKYPIYLVTMETRHLLSSTFMRFQEHYESPEFRRKIFTREEYEDWYVVEGCSRKKKAFTYYQDWRGFNVPSWVLTPFLEGKFSPLTEKEKRLISAFQAIEGSFYIIGVSVEVGNDPSFVKHEFVHGLYFTSPEYKEKVNVVLERYDTTRFDIGLQKLGYAREVWSDEINAYCTTGLGKSLSKAGNIDKEAVKPLQAELRALFKDHLGFSMTRARPNFFLSLMHEVSL